MKLSTCLFLALLSSVLIFKADAIPVASLAKRSGSERPILAGRPVPDWWRPYMTYYGSPVKTFFKKGKIDPASLNQFHQRVINLNTARNEILSDRRYTLSARDRQILQQQFHSWNDVNPHTRDIVEVGRAQQGFFEDEPKISAIEEVIARHVLG